MDSASPTGCCNCGCPYCSAAASPIYRRSVKRKADPPGWDVPSPAGFARVEVEDELAAHRETLASQQAAIQELSVELEEERKAAETAANETMSMILRLQREKAEVQMESRQFRRFAEEKMDHDGREIADLEDLLFKRDQEVQALSYEIRAYQHRLLSLGIDVEQDHISLNSFTEDQFDIPADGGYPSLRCDAGDDCYDGGGPSDIEHRIHELEKNPTSARSKSLKPPPEHLPLFSTENSSSSIPHESSEMVNGSGDVEDDETDRIYTIDAVHGFTVVKEGSSQKGGLEAEEGDIKKLYTRLQALEADRESMRQAIISMRTEKAQLVLLREIAQQLGKEAKPERRVVKKKPSFFGVFSFVSFIKPL
ncbi:hypothetical protein KSP40_PGU015917 [Platanthera guangdongensis]|uniref:GTD-binding domain-containing protein n=1 Tax=Platanthera guangdongensis TaxID=2320717 RepID=A0ABR2MB94_9ASPA